MKKVKTAELTGPALDWAVATCEGYECQFEDEVSGPWLVPQEGFLHDEKSLSQYSPSTSWSQGGPIIEREKISVGYERYGAIGGETWDAVKKSSTDDTTLWLEYGPTPLVAAMRCYVAAEMGDTIEIPEELLT